MEYFVEIVWSMVKYGHVYGQYFNYCIIKYVSMMVFNYFFLKSSERDKGPHMQCYMGVMGMAPYSLLASLYAG